MGKDYIRRAHHAGSWYSDDHHQLNNELQSYLNGVVENEEEARLPRAIIAPHAGYSYSGPTAAYAYIHLKEALEQGWHGTVVVLHPSHHVHLDGCAVSGTMLL
jgi:AmmeMemoRadiSam system protein B